jgi:NitT/TauT family transport system ATP-binding protein
MTMELARETGPVVQATPVLLRLDDVRCTLTDRAGITRDVLGPISLSIGRGERIAIIGPSGAGKSTLLRIIAMLQAPSAGSITAGGADGTRPTIAMAMQDPSLMPWLDLTSNLMLPATLGPRPLAPEVARARAFELVARMGLKGFEHARPEAMSGGMQSRANLARALVSEPDILLLDEPFGSLDEVTSESIMLDLSGFVASKQCAIVMVSHNISQALFLADRVLVISTSPARMVGSVAVTAPHARGLDVLTSAGHREAARQVRALLEQASCKQ